MNDDEGDNKEFLKVEKKRLESGVSGRLVTVKSLKDQKAASFQLVHGRPRKTTRLSLLTAPPSPPKGHYKATTSPRLSPTCVQQIFAPFASQLVIYDVQLTRPPAQRGLRHHTGPCDTRTRGPCHHSISKSHAGERPIPQLDAA